MTRDEEAVSQEIGEAIERAFGKLDQLFAGLGDDIQVIDDVEVIDDVPPLEPAEAWLPAAVVAVGPTGEWWPASLHWLQPGEALVLVSLALAWLAVGVAGVPVPLRVFATFSFLLACPGFAAMRLLAIRNAGVLATLSIAASIGIDTVLSEAMLYGHTWSPGAAVAGLAGFSVVALAAARLRGDRLIHALP